MSSSLATFFGIGENSGEGKRRSATYLSLLGASRAPPARARVRARARNGRRRRARGDTATARPAPDSPSPPP